MSAAADQWVQLQLFAQTFSFAFEFPWLSSFEKVDLGFALPAPCLAAFRINLLLLHTWCVSNASLNIWQTNGFGYKFDQPNQEPFASDLSGSSQ